MAASWRGKADAAGPPGLRQAEAALPPPALPFPEEEVAAGPHFDDSDCPTEVRGANDSQKIMNITSSFANQLLLVSMLEHLCHVYEQDPARSRRLFELLCKTFTKMHLLSDLAVREEFSSLRLQHNRAIATLMKAANNQILKEEIGNGSSFKNRENEVIFEAQTSRYINEFDEVSRLGKGGYGTVYKVRNKLDGQFYAIKKILIKKATKRDCMKVLREVKVLAGLQHPNIVGYHTAWMEHVQPACPKGEKNLNLPLLTVSSRQENSVEECMEDSSSIIFADPEDSAGRDSVGDKTDASAPLAELLGSSCPNNTSSGSGYSENHPSVVPRCNQEQQHMSTNDSYSDEECSPKRMSLQQHCEMEYHVMLHIQMQLCEISLWDWIVDRNKRCFEVEGPFHHVDSHRIQKIFQELLEGVYYIHSMGIMHRDIKPRNIFLQGSDHHVKIGDFGLACRDIIQEDTPHLLSARKINELIHTSGVGTCLYASPEQLQGSHYDFKSDMYSLGIILFELFQPFGTEMERNEVLMGLRKSQIPHSFSRKWPVQTKYVKLLTSVASSNRPTAAQLLESELFHSPANVICSLQQKVKQQEEEINFLKERVKLLLQEKSERDRTEELGSPV
uniref:Eukaryotic translation initiation factor 2-alpha kinase 1 n=1 Tax=Pogona vitticeps TaxID=103695 RepID=A0ABM5F0X9_9SAUR